MNYTIESKLPYHNDPDYAQKFIQEVASISGYPIDISCFDGYGYLMVDINNEQLDKLSKSPMIGTIMTLVDYEIMKNHKLLIKS